MKFEQFLIDNSNCVPQQSSEDSTTHPMAGTVPSSTFGWVPEKRKLNCIIIIIKCSLGKIGYEKRQTHTYYSERII